MSIVSPTTQIHPSAVVDAGATLGDGVIVGPLCYVGPKVTLGAGTRLVSHVSVLNRTTLGQNNTVWPHTTLGADPQDLKFKGEDTELVIGDNNDIRESVTIHIGTQNGGGVTRIGSHNLIMVGAHIAHDCILGSHIILANAVLLAGHIQIEDHALLSGAVAVHHFVTIGEYAFIGGMTRVVHDVPPYVLLEGQPAKVRGVNVIGLERNNFPAESIANLKEAFKRLFRDASSGEPSAAGNMIGNLEQLEAKMGDDPCIARLGQFLRNKNVGRFGRFLENQRTDDRHHNPAR